MTAIAKLFDRMNIEETNEKASFVSRNKRNNRGGMGKKEDKPNNRPRIPPQLQYKCFRCAKEGHSTKDCRISKTLECNACKKTSYLKVACMQELWKQGPSKPKERKALAVQEDSDGITRVEYNFEKVYYVSPAKDRGTEAPLIKMWLSQNGKSVAKVKGPPATRCTTSLIRNDIVNRNKIIINELVSPTLKVVDGKRLPVEGTTKFTWLTSSGKRADIGAIATTAIDEEMLISFKDMETLKHIPIGFPNTVVEQFDCYEKAKAISAGTLPLEEEFRDIIGDELKPKPMNCAQMEIELIPGVTPSKNMYRFH